MLTSTEVRWFVEGPVPADVAQWFCRGGLLAAAAPREDQYLLFPAALGLNVKLREGRLEIKSLVKTLGTRTFTPEVAGRVERWEKRIGGDAAAQEFERLRSGAPHLWIAVRKERTLRKFSLDGAAPREVAAATVFLTEGCNAELTKIVVQGMAHWSLALEAYGDPARLEASLMTVAARVFSDKPHSPGLFSADSSHSYPAWLGTVSRAA